MHGLYSIHLSQEKKDNWHTHPPKSSYVLSGGKLKVFLENGETIIADKKPELHPGWIM